MSMIIKVNRRLFAYPGFTDFSAIIFLCEISGSMDKEIKTVWQQRLW